MEEPVVPKEAAPAVTPVDTESKPLTKAEAKILQDSVLKEPPLARKPLTKAQKLMFAGALLLVIGSITSITLAYKKQAAKPTECGSTGCATPTPLTSATLDPTAPTPTPVSRHLDGSLVTPGTENDRILGVMIENHPEARPQSGLAQANWVYEAIAEGGITRFLALYANASGTNVRVGPVRSVRTYFLDYAREYNALLAHVGGSITALDEIQAKGGVTDLDQFSIGSPVFARDTSRNVSTEHTMFSNTNGLWNYSMDRKYEKTSTFQPIPFTDEAASADRGTTQTVSIDFSEAQYAVKWTYDAASNSYARSLGGSVHKDSTTGQAITAKNIVIQTVAKADFVTRYNKHEWKYTLTGTGKVVIINNGHATVGTWKRTGNERTRYYDAAGTEISLVRGTTWVEVTHSDTPASY